MEYKIDGFVNQHGGIWIDSDGNRITIKPYSAEILVLNPDGKYCKEIRILCNGRFYAKDDDELLKYWNKESERKLIDRIKLFVEKRLYDFMSEYMAKNILSEIERHSLTTDEADAIARLI
jgi:hypothetical protein